MADLERLTWYLNIAATIVLILRLSFNGLYRVYRLLFIYLFIDTLQQALRLMYVSNRNRTVEIYMAGQAVKVILSIFVVLGLYELALAAQPALARYGRKTVGVVLTVAAVAAAGLLSLDRAVVPGSSLILHNFLSFERTIDVGLLFFLLMISFFMTWFPVRLRLNVAYYIGGFVVYFFSHAAGLLLMNVLPPNFRTPLNIAMLSVSFACLLVWVFALSETGEEVGPRSGGPSNPTGMGRVAAQLESINASLGRLSGR